MANQSIDAAFFDLSLGGVFGYDDGMLFGFGDDDEDVFGYGDALSVPMISGHDVSNIELVQFFQFYETTSYRGGAPVQFFSYTVNAHAATENDARQMAKEIYSAINRIKMFALDGYGLPICDIGEAFSDEEHNWVCPVSVRIQTNIQ